MGLTRKPGAAYLRLSTRPVTSARIQAARLLAVDVAPPAAVAEEWLSAVSPLGRTVPRLLLRLGTSGCTGGPQARGRDGGGAAVTYPCANGFWILLEATAGIIVCFRPSGPNRALLNYLGQRLVVQLLDDCKAKQRVVRVAVLIGGARGVGERVVREGDRRQHLPRGPDFGWVTVT